MTIVATERPAADVGSPAVPWVARRPRTALVVVAFLVALAAFVGWDVSSRLSSGGYTPTRSESAAADRILASRFHAGAPNLVLLADLDASAVAAGRDLTERVGALPDVGYAQSYWTTGRDNLLSRDRRAGLILVRLNGDESRTERAAGRVLAAVARLPGDVRVRATGSAEVNREADAVSKSDLTRAELIAAPLTLAILLLAFDSVVAAALPMLVGLIAVLGTFAMLRLLSLLMTISVYAENITTALGFALAVDYSLFILTRYREELARGSPVASAVAVASRSAGRTAMFSAVTVACALAGLLAFPLTFLRSLAIAGIAVTLLAALTATLVLPSLFVLLGTRVDSLKPRRILRRRVGRHRRAPDPDAGVIHRLALLVMRRPVLISSLVIGLLLVLALPYRSARFGLTDDQVLPAQSTARQVGDRIRADFEARETSPITVVLPRTADPAAVDRFALSIAAQRDIDRVTTVTGTYADGRGVAGPSGLAAAYRDGRGAWLEVTADVDPEAGAARRLVASLRALPAPGPVLVGGDTAVLVDTLSALGGRLPLAAALMLLGMTVLLFAFTRSVVIPIKAAVTAVLSLTASFGALVWIFQDGHLHWLAGDFAVTGRLEVTIPIVMFCIAFGVSVDYEMFLLAWVSEEYRRTGDTRRAVAWGLQRNGRLITAAALTIAAVLGALSTSQLVLLKILGVGLALAVVVDATIVRCLLVPAMLRLLGPLNWWAPRALRSDGLRVPAAGLAKARRPPAVRDAPGAHSRRG